MNPTDLLYTRNHEWIRIDADTGVVGITEHAQESLGDVVYVELPRVGDSFTAGGEFGAVESVKSVSSLFLPVSGQIIEVNEALEKTPELVNEAPYGEGWMVGIRLGAPDEAQSLLSAEDYGRFVATGEDS